jgi:hypothetical protein
MESLREAYVNVPRHASVLSFGLERPKKNKNIKK